MRIVEMITIVNNFFDNPNLVRELALSQTFSKPDGNYPGVRTESLDKICPDFYEFFILKMFSLFFDTSTDDISISKFNAYFQLTSEEFETGWVHQDTEMMAGVVYLTPNPPLTGGTSVYEFTDKIDFKDYDIRDNFYSGKDLDLNKYKTVRDNHNSKFPKTLDVSNIYNRLFVYDGKFWHKENHFFGSGKNSRLTLVFFTDFKTKTTPIIRSQLSTIKMRKTW